MPTAPEGTLQSLKRQGRRELGSRGRDPINKFRGLIWGWGEMEGSTNKSGGLWPDCRRTGDPELVLIILFFPPVPCPLLPCLARSHWWTAEQSCLYLGKLTQSIEDTILNTNYIYKWELISLKLKVRLNLINAKHTRKNNLNKSFLRDLSGQGDYAFGYVHEVRPKTCSSYLCSTPNSNSENW